MTAQELDEAMQTLDLGSYDVAELLGVKQRTVQTWLKGHPAVPEPAARILRYLIRSGVGAHGWATTLNLPTRDAA